MGSNSEELPSLPTAKEEKRHKEEEALLEAVECNNVPKIRKLIKNHPSLLELHRQKIFLTAFSKKGVQDVTIRCLLELDADCRNDKSDNNQELIHLAAQATNFKVLNILLEDSPARINALDQYRNNALHILLQDGNKENKYFGNCAIQLVMEGICIDQSNSNHKTPLHIAEEKGYSDIKARIENFKHKNPHTVQLKSYISKRDEDNCIKEIDCITDKELIKNGYPVGSSTLLPICYKEGLFKVVEHLLSKDISIQNMGEPIGIATQKGDLDMLEIFLKASKGISGTVYVLGNVLCYTDRESKDYRKCREFVIKKIQEFYSRDDESWLTNRSMINVYDEDGYTLLDYAVWFADSHIVKMLLSLGAYAGAPGGFGPAINHMDPVTWKEHLDSCIDLPGYSDICSPNFKITFNFETLISPYGTKTTTNCEKDPETPSKSEENLDSNAFSISESEVVLSMIKLPDFQEYLTHPVIVSLITLKWQKCQWLFWTNLLLYLIYMIFFSMYVISDCFNVFNSIFMIIMRFGLIIGLFMFVIRESFQMFLDRWKYFKVVDNYIELSLIGITFLILSDLVKATRSIWSICILLLSFELISVLRNHPYFSTDIILLRTVFYNFFRIFTAYFLLILSFAFSFYTLFNTTTDQSISDTANKNAANFSTIGESIFKTIIMLTGEFDSSSINFDKYAVISKIVFVLFIFVIHLVFLNLLNGLAVSDTQIIRAKAKILGEIARIEYVKKAERVLGEKKILFEFINKLRKMFNLLPLNMNLQFAKRCTLYFYPMKNQFLNAVDQFSYLGLDEETINKIYKIIRSKRERSESEDSESEDLS